MAPGPFRADQIRSGDPYELSDGHPIRCLPTGGRGSRANLIGAAVLDSDPAVESAGVDTGFALSPTTLRAPDVAVGNKVLFGKYAGSEVKLNGVEHLILREDEILAVLD